MRFRANHYDKKMSERLRRTIDAMLSMRMYVAVLPEIMVQALRSRLSLATCSVMSPLACGSVSDDDSAVSAR